MPIYEDKSRKNQVMLSTRLRVGEHDFIIDSFTKLENGVIESSPQTTPADATRQVLYTLLEFYLSNGSTSPDMVDPVEFLRRRVDDNHEVLLGALSQLMERVDDITIVSGGYHPPDTHNQDTELMDAPDFLLDSFLSDHLKQSGDR